MTQQAPAFLGMILDRSGSMQSIREDAIGGFNAFLEDQKNLPGDAFLTLVQFDNEYEVVHDGLPLKDVPFLTRRTFVPRGDTAVLDAIGRTINAIETKIETMPEPKPQVIVVILTDGKENASQEFTPDVVARLIADHIAKGWQFLYLGANQDAIMAAAKLNIAGTHSRHFATNGQGVKDAFTDTSISVSRSRAGGSGGFGSDSDSKGKVH